CPGIFYLSEKLVSRLPVLLDGLAVCNEAGITQRNPLGDLKTFVGFIGVQDRVAAIDGKPADDLVDRGVLVRSCQEEVDVLGSFVDTRHEHLGVTVKACGPDTPALPEVVVRLLLLDRYGWD